MAAQRAIRQLQLGYQLSAIRYQRSYQVSAHAVIPSEARDPAALRVATTLGEAVPVRKIEIPRCARDDNVASGRG